VLFLCLPGRSCAFSWNRVESSSILIGIIGYLSFHYSWLKSVTVIIPRSQSYSSEGGLYPIQKWHYSIFTTTKIYVINLLCHYSSSPPKTAAAWLTFDTVKACSRFHIVLTTDFSDLFTSWNTITYLIYRAKYLAAQRHIHLIHVVINQSLVGTLCMWVWRAIIAVRFKGGVVTMFSSAINSVVLFPCELAWQSSLIASFHSVNWSEQSVQQ